MPTPKVLINLSENMWILFKRLKINSNAYVLKRLTFVFYSRSFILLRCNHKLPPPLIVVNEIIIYYIVYIKWNLLLKYQIFWMRTLLRSPDRFMTYDLFCRRFSRVTFRKPQITKIISLGFLVEELCFETRRRCWYDVIYFISALTRIHLHLISPKMRALLTLFFAVIGGTVAASQAADQSEERRLGFFITPRIIGGNNVPLGLYPW